MSKNERMVGISRRTLVKSTAIGSLALAAGGFSLPFTLRSAAAAVQQASEKVVWGACSVNCGSRCALRLHVKDNEVIWVETDNTGNDEYGNHQVRACLRGRSIRRRINHPDRLNYPMKRVGKRGEGKFERISWDEALDTIASSLKKTVEQYGNEAVYIQYSSGIVGGNMTRSSPSASAVKRLMNCYGGSLNQYGSYSTAQISCAMPYTYGSNDGNSTTDIENSKLVVMFGNNPAETRMSGGGITYLLEKAREKSNAKMIVIDPRYTDTAAGREDEWLPIRPGTDAALVAGIAWVLINENLVDQPFLDKYCVGYDEKTLPADAPKNGHYKAYILGEGDDKTAKTPQWASQITGIPVDRIIKLAREIGTAKPAYAASLVKSLASLLVVTSGSAIGREGAMILLAALAASCFAQRFTPRQEWKLWIACGAAAGMAAAYRAPLAGSLFIAEVLFGTMMLASLGPVIISAVVALLVSNLINHSDALLYNVQLSVTVQARDYALIISTGVLAGLCGPLLLTLMNACHRGFVSLKLAPPWQLALGGLIVGLLSLFTPAVWGNGYSTVQSFLTAPPLLMIIAGIFLCKLCAVLASSGSGAPGGVFTPTLFIGLAIGMLYGRSLGLWFPDGEEITLLLGLTGMATLLAATTHAPIMSTLMICEMTGEYQLLPGLLIACVIASVISRTLHRDSIYRQHTAQHS